MNESDYANHPLRASVEQVTSLIQGEAFSNPLVLVSEHHAFSRDKILATTKLIKAKFENTPAVLTSTHGLSQLHSNFQSVANEIHAFASDKNISHLLNAAAHIDQNILPLMWAFSTGADAAGKTAISSLAHDVRQSAKQAIESLRKETEALSATLTAQHQSAGEIEEKLTALADSITSHKAETLAINAQIQQQYAESETARAASFSTAMEGFKKILESTDREAKQSAANLLLALNTSKDEASQIVQVVGNIGVTGNYQRIAKEEAEKADLWRWFTVGAFAIGIVAAIATFLKLLFAPLTPETAWSALIRLLYALAFAAPAWYFAKESARHRSNADQARQTELELASLGPFIELMDSTTKNRIREELAKRYFGNGNTPHTVENPFSAKEVKELIVETVKAAKT
jgi:hypothetical protein